LGHKELNVRITDEWRDEAIAFARSFGRSIKVLFDVVDCVAFPPVRIISGQNLPA
jgi:hypothetical protein